MKTRFFIAILLLLGSMQSAQARPEPECPRIVSQSPYITKSLQWLDLEPCIVGVSRYDALDRPRTGGVLDPDGDIIATLEPGLIFTSDWTTADKLAAATPEGTRSFRLHGFGSMAEVEENLRLIGRAANVPDIEGRVAGFHRQWTSLAHRVKGEGRKVLLLSACSGMPYSFGRKRWLSDLFTEAGFVVVETAETIRHIKPGEEVTSLNALIDEFQPELLFIFERKQNKQCAFIRPKTPLRIINLDGEKFLHPAPVVLEGLAELRRHQAEWKAK